MSLVQIQGNASGTGTLTVAAPSTNTNRTLTLPDGTGTFSVAGVNSNIVSGTVQTAPPTTPQYFDFTSIPSWVKQITVMFSGVSLSGTGNLSVLIGPVAGVESTGYASMSSSLLGSTIATTSSTSSFLLSANNAAAATYQGSIVLTNLSGNIWTAQGVLARATDFGYGYAVGGSKTLAGTLSIVRITGNGTDTFDAGSINILYE